MKKFLSLLLSLCLFVSLIPGASAVETGREYEIDLSGLMKNERRRTYVEMMLDYHLRTNKAVRKTLEEGCSAMFLFEGCSDNMDHPDLSMIDYYRVSAVCIVLKLDEEGKPYISFFNQNCSTIPDRPLAYGAWSLEKVGEVGPATICDGTYELYSVRHGGVYEALHLRTTYEDASIDAVYMTPEGYVTARATSINIHTRTGNHALEKAMWSAGCLLVGDGDFGQFTELMESMYYSCYDYFVIDAPVGTVTIDRWNLKEKLYQLYDFPDAVDRFLTNTRQIQPETYLRRCTGMETYEDIHTLRTIRDTELMTLPCSSRTDARSVVLETLPEGEQLQAVSMLTNPLGNSWYGVPYGEGTAYLYCGDAVEAPPVSWFGRFWNSVFG